MQQTDFLVIGSGIAGLTYALKISEQYPDKRILVMTKAAADETNTKYAQGGIAVVNDLENDSFEKHIEDTLIAGDGLCNEEVVEIVVKEGPERVQEIIEWGAKFDKEKDGDYKRGREGGHSEFRILHYKDITGREMERALLDAVSSRKNIEFIKHCFVVDIITQHHLGYLVSKATPDVECFGVYVLNLHTNKIEKILSNITLLATGGNGQVYRTTTNPSIATGDGVAMVYRAKGRIENMEFIQFHPTALYEPGVKGQAFLITEAVRGDGGILRNKDGDAFMGKYDERKDLAPRDIVARAIDSEMKRTGTEHVWLDCRHFEKEKFIEHFPNIYDKCLSIGIDITQHMIPVAPAAHYSCGGIKTDEWGRSSIRNLYACGECASTGLHGANRLASNSLLEAMVFAHRCFVDAVAKYERDPGFSASRKKASGVPDWNAEGTTVPREMILITQSLKELQLVMSDYVGIVRNNVRLQRALRRLDLLWEETEQLYESSTLSPQLLELRNMITVGYLVVKGAAFRKESRGLHYNTDYPEKSPLVQNIVL
jgi:L-aspartate oxidase